jgi:hypothetical protein
MRSRFDSDLQDAFGGSFNAVWDYSSFLPFVADSHGTPPASTPPAFPSLAIPEEAVLAQNAQSGSATAVAATSGRGGITINLLFDAAAMAAPQSFRTGVEQAASVLAATIKDQITVNIKIDYSGTGGGAAAGPDNGQYVSYSTVKADLINDAAPGDTTFNALPAGSSFQGQTNVVVWNAQLKAMGLLGANLTTTDDGSATFATDISPGLLVGVALHELTHALGRVPYGPQPDIFDFFRFTGPGTQLIAGGSTAPAAYFSVDGGNTKLADFGQISDPSDFLNPPGSNLTPNDAFNEFYTGSTNQYLTSVDKELLDALGFPLGARGAVGFASPAFQTLPGDYDGNGKTDLAVIGSGLGGIDTYLSNGDGTFKLDYSSQTGSDWVDWPSAKAITGDFNGDGKTDIAVTAYGLGGIGSYLSNGDGTFHAVYSSQTGSDWVDWPGAKAITGDFNGDGKTDIVVTANGLGGFGSYLSNGDGTFHAVYSSQTGSDWVDWPGAKAITGDFNGDGKTDIVVTANGLGGFGSYLSNGDGTFHAVYSSQTGSDWVDWPGAKAITGDFNGDGKTDIAVTAYGLGGIGSYLSNGDGTFHGVYSSQTGSDWVDWPNAQAITGDFNGDGKTDIAVIAPGLGGFGTYLSNGNGTFHAVYSSQAGSDWVDWPGAKVSTGDFNGDGRTDIAVTAPGLQGIGVYLSNGDGTFHAIFSPQVSSSAQPGAANPAQAAMPANGNVFVGSPGNDVLTGTGANDTFVFAFGNTGHEVISNFQPSSDTIEFENVNFTNFQQLQALMEPSGSDVVINLSASESVTLHGTTIDALHASNFIILGHGILS